MSDVQKDSLINLMKGYVGQSVLVSSDSINDEDGLLLEDADLTIKDEIICLMDKENKIQFSLNKIEDIYLNKLDICLGSDAEIHIRFTCCGEEFNLINLT